MILAGVCPSSVVAQYPGNPYTTGILTTAQLPTADALGPLFDLDPRTADGTLLIPSSAGLMLLRGGMVGGNLTYLTHMLVVSAAVDTSNGRLYFASDLSFYWQPLTGGGGAPTLLFTCTNSGAHLQVLLPGGTNTHVFFRCFPTTIYGAPSLIRYVVATGVSTVIGDSGNCVPNHFAYDPTQNRGTVACLYKIGPAGAHVEMNSWGLI